MIVKFVVNQVNVKSVKLDFTNIMVDVLLVINQVVQCALKMVYVVRVKMKVENGNLEMVNVSHYVHQIIN